MRIVIATDAWQPFVCGVVTTLNKTVAILRQQGHEVMVLHPGLFKTWPLPTYPDIRIALFPYRKLKQQLDEFAPEIIHIATEGPIGLAARRYCLRKKLKFTTAYHTQFPEYIRLRAPLPVALSYAYFKWFHGPAAATMVPTPSIQQRLAKRGFRDVKLWGRGVDIELFRPDHPHDIREPRPIFIYVGRIAVEKNIEAFLSLELPGTKYVIGDGPDLEWLKQKYPDAVFTGYLPSEVLVKYLAAADVFVFPSLTDTFGLVMLEAMACGLPVAAYPVTGPIDVVIHGITGVLDPDLKVAALKALHINRENPRDYVLSHSWHEATRQFFSNLAEADEII